MTILSNNYNSVLEAYYGKPKEFLIIEKELDKIIKQIKENIPIVNFKDNIAPKKIIDFSNSDEIILIEKIFQKFFGFKEFFLSIYYPITPKLYTIPFNGFTIPRAFNYFRRDIGGKPDTSSMSVGVNINIILIRYLDLTAEELMGVILHEIGHNLDTSIFSFLSRFVLDLDKITNETKKETIERLIGQLIGLGIIDFIQLGKIVSKFIQAFEGFLTDVAPGFLKLTTLYWEFYLNFNFIHTFKIFNQGVDFKKLIYKIITPGNIFGYAGEKYADSIATSYGYGMALSSFQNKVQKRENFIINKTLYEIPVLNWIYDFMGVMLSIISCVSDPHPQDAVRINAQLLKLKRDIKDPNLNPRLKKSLEEEINELEKYINDYYLNIETNDNKKRIFTWMFNYMIIKIFNNNIDFRELLENIWRHEE
jgi:hypothetical protein